MNLGLYVYRIPQQMMKYLPLCTLCEPNFHTSIITLNWGQWLVPPPISYHQPSCDHLSKQGDAGVLSEKRLPQKSNGFSWYHHFPYSSGHLWLVGGFNPSEKYEFVSWGYYSQYMESQKKPWFQTTNQIHCYSN